MIKFMRSAVVVVACLFAGAGAWGAAVVVDNSGHVYASELFGAGHAAVNYPDGKTPMVQMTIPGNLATSGADNPLTDAVDDTRTTATTDGTTHMGEAEVTFTLIGGTFDANISGLLWDSDLATDTADLDNDEDDNPDTPPTATIITTIGAATRNDYVAAPGTVVSIVSGGRKGDNSITIKVEAAIAADGTEDPSMRFAGKFQRIGFYLPPLTDVALAGANSQNEKTSDDFKYVWLNATSRIVSGAFTDGPLVPAVVPNFYATLVMRSRDAVTLEVTDPNTRTIAIDDDAAKGLTAFMSVKEKNKGGYVELATVTVMTIHEMTAKKDGADAKHMYNTFGPAATDTAVTSRIFSLEEAGADAVPWTLYGLDGQVVDAGLRGTLTMMAEGTRGLFNEDDMLFIDYDKNGKMGAGEGIAIDGMMAMGEALSIDADKSESFSGGTGAFKVFYMPGGKGAINHGSMIKLTAMVNYSDPTAIDETPRGSATTLNFDGVGNPVMAYAIPHSTNGTGDKANVRVRCEQPAPGADACRVFAECWDDMGNRGFGEGPMVAENNVMVANSAAVEMITGLEPMSRVSCRVLSRGMVTVQQLTRDGNSGTLVNNTYVGGGM